MSKVSEVRYCQIWKSSKQALIDVLAAKAITYLGQCEYRFLVWLFNWHKVIIRAVNRFTDGFRVVIIGLASFAIRSNEFGGDNARPELLAFSALIMGATSGFHIS